MGEMKIVEMHIVQERSVGCCQSVAKMHNHGIQGKLISVWDKEKLLINKVKKFDFYS